MRVRRGVVGVVAALAVALVGSVVAGTSAQGAVPDRFRIIQMNLCLSGQAEWCYYDPSDGDANEAPPAMSPRRKVREAAKIINNHDPNAVTLNEVCYNDVRKIHRRTEYQRRFTWNHDDWCEHGGGKYGIAIMAREFNSTRVDRWNYDEGDHDHNWGMCARTASKVLVCTSHLHKDSPQQQCDKLKLELADRRGAVVFGGDVNRQGDDPCRYSHMWGRSDHMANGQLPGLQHVYVDNAAFDPVDSWDRLMTSTDHNAFGVVMKQHR